MFGAVVGLFRREWASFSARQHKLLYAQRAIGYAITRPSVYLFVCLSVTRVDQSKMAEVRVTQFSAYYPSSFCLGIFIQKF